MPGCSRFAATTAIPSGGHTRGRGFVRDTSRAAPHPPATTGYILIAIPLEERNLADAHLEYAQYKRKVPMLIPSVRRHLAGETHSLAPETR